MYSIDVRKVNGMHTVQKENEDNVSDNNQIKYDIFLNSLDPMLRTNTLSNVHIVFCFHAEMILKVIFSFS